MSKADPEAKRKERNKSIRWVLLVFVITLVISGCISLVSEELMSSSGIFVCFVILFAIVLIGIVFDVIGVAVTSADERPFHSMAARKVPGATEAIRLLRRAEKVSSICNDVIGDICGVVSGSASATIAALILASFEFSWPKLITLLMSSAVSAMTVGGKAVCKRFAIESSTAIVHTVGRVIHVITNIPTLFQKKKK